MLRPTIIPLVQDATVGIDAHARLGNASALLAKSSHDKVCAVAEVGFRAMGQGERAFTAPAIDGQFFDNKSAGTGNCMRQAEYAMRLVERNNVGGLHVANRIK